MVKVKLKDFHVGYQLVKKLGKNYFLGRLEPSKEAGSPLLFSKSFFPDFLYEILFWKVFWGSFGGKKAIYEKKIHESGL